MGKEENSVDHKRTKLGLQTSLLEGTLFILGLSVLIFFILD